MRTIINMSKHSPRSFEKITKNLTEINKNKFIRDIREFVSNTDEIEGTCQSKEDKIEFSEDSDNFIARRYRKLENVKLNNPIKLCKEINEEKIKETCNLNEINKNNPLKLDRIGKIDRTQFNSDSLNSNYSSNMCNLRKDNMNNLRKENIGHDKKAHSFEKQEKISKINKQNLVVGSAPNQKCFTHSMRNKSLSHPITEVTKTSQKPGNYKSSVFGRKKKCESNGNKTSKAQQNLNKLTKITSRETKQCDKGTTDTDDKPQQKKSKSLSRGDIRKHDSACFVKDRTNHETRCIEKLSSSETVIRCSNLINNSDVWRTHSEKNCGMTLAHKREELKNDHRSNVKEVSNSSKTSFEKNSISSQSLKPFLESCCNASCYNCCCELIASCCNNKKQNREYCNTEPQNSKLNKQVWDQKLRKSIEKSSTSNELDNMRINKFCSKTEKHSYKPKEIMNTERGGNEKSENNNCQKKIYKESLLKLFDIIGESTSTPDPLTSRNSSEIYECEFSKYLENKSKIRLVEKQTIVFSKLCQTSPSKTRKDSKTRLDDSNSSVTHCISSKHKITENNGYEILKESLEPRRFGSDANCSENLERVQNLICYDERTTQSDTSNNKNGNSAYETTQIICSKQALGLLNFKKPQKLVEQDNNTTNDFCDKQNKLPSVKQTKLPLLLSPKTHKLEAPIINSNFSPIEVVRDSRHTPRPSKLPLALSPKTEPNCHNLDLNKLKAIQITESSDSPAPKSSTNDSDCPNSQKSTNLDSDPFENLNITVNKDASIECKCRLKSKIESLRSAIEAECKYLLNSLTEESYDSKFNSKGFFNDNKTDEINEKSKLNNYKCPHFEKAKLNKRDKTFLFNTNEQQNDSYKGEGSGFFLDTLLQLPPEKFEYCYSNSSKKSSFFKSKEVPNKMINSVINSCEEHSMLPDDQKKNQLEKNESPNFSNSNKTRYVPNTNLKDDGTYKYCTPLNNDRLSSEKKGSFLKENVIPNKTVVNSGEEHRMLPDNQKKNQLKKRAGPSCSNSNKRGHTPNTNLKNEGAYKYCSPFNNDRLQEEKNMSSPKSIQAANLPITKKKFNFDSSTSSLTNSSDKNTNKQTQLLTLTRNSENRKGCFIDNESENSFVTKNPQNNSFDIKSNFKGEAICVQNREQKKDMLTYKSGHCSNFDCNTNSNNQGISSSNNSEITAKKPEQLKIMNRISDPSKNRNSYLIDNGNDNSFVTVTQQKKSCAINCCLSNESLYDPNTEQKKRKLGTTNKEASFNSKVKKISNKCATGNFKKEKDQNPQVSKTKNLKELDLDFDLEVFQDGSDQEYLTNRSCKSEYFSPNASPKYIGSDLLSFKKILQPLSTVNQGKFKEFLNVDSIKEKCLSNFFEHHKSSIDNSESKLSARCSKMSEMAKNRKCQQINRLIDRPQESGVEIKKNNAVRESTKDNPKIQQLPTEKLQDRKRELINMPLGRLRGSHIQDKNDNEVRRSASPANNLEIQTFETFSEINAPISPQWPPQSQLSRRERFMSQLVIEPAESNIEQNQNFKSKPIIPQFRGCDCMRPKYERMKRILLGSHYNFFPENKSIDYVDDRFDYKRSLCH